MFFVLVYVIFVQYLEISGGIYNTAGFLQRDSWQKDTNIKRRRWVVWRSHTHFREGVAMPDYNIIRVGGERSEENSSRDFFVASFSLQQLR